MSTNRIEAFSDGVIAIIITIMVFDLKLQEIPLDTTVWAALLSLLPKFSSYIISFFMVAVMWVNHHQLFHQVKHSNGGLLWHNIHLLFWMSLLPFGTHFIGSNPFLWQASLVYGILFFFNAFAFTLLRDYVFRKKLLYGHVDAEKQQKIRIKNRVSMGVYALSAALSPLSVYLSFALFLLVPLMYFIPEKVTTNTEH